MTDKTYVLLTAKDNKSSVRLCCKKKNKLSYQQQSVALTNQEVKRLKIMVTIVDVMGLYA